MAEWTGAKREEMYALLAQGNLAAARDLVAECGQLKRRDYGPQNKQALAQLAELLNTRRDLRDELAAMIVDVREPVYTLALMIWDLVEMPLDALFSQYEKVAEEIEARFIADEIPQRIEWKSPYHPLQFYELESRLRQMLIRLLGALLKHPPDEVLSMLKKGKELPAVYLQMNKRTARMLKDAQEAFAKKQQQVTTRKTIAQATGEAIDEETAVRLRKAIASADLKTLQEAIRKFPECPLSKAGLSEDEMTILRKKVGKDRQLQKAMLEMLVDGFTLGHSIALEALGSLQKHTAVLECLAGRLKKSWRNYSLGPTWKIPAKERPPLDRIVDLLLPAFSPALLEELQRFRNGNPQFWAREYLGQEIISRLIEEKGAKAASDYIKSIVDQTDHREKKVRQDNFEEMGFGEELERLLAHRLRGDQQSENLKSDPLYNVTCALRDPKKYLKMDAAKLTAEMKKPFGGGTAFDVALVNPKLLDEIQCDIVPLVAQKLWSEDANAVESAILKLEALAIHGKFDPQRITGELEQVFLMEKPRYWRRATESLRRIMIRFPQVSMSNPDRIQELIERDPAKYKKLLQPLLK